MAKTVLSVRTPFACTIAEINTPLEQTPFKVNRSPYLNWLVKVVPERRELLPELLLEGPAVAVRAHELMDLHGMHSLTEFQRSTGLS